MKEPRVFLAMTCLVAFQAATVCASAQDVLGTNMGIPNSSPAVQWPRGMSLEALSPSNLYPNGPQFGLSNTSGGFGTTGSGPISGVGLAQRSVSSLVQQEFARPSYVSKLSALESAEALRGRSILSTVLGSRLETEMSRPSFVIPGQAGPGIVAPASLPSVDSVLQDRPASTDAILRTNL